MKFVLIVWYIQKTISFRNYLEFPKYRGENLQNIPEQVKNKLGQLPDLPGIYRMLDSQDNIIYIGKSKCLKNRVKSYFTASPKWEKVKKMVSLIKDIDFTITDTHLEARLLECELIKKHKPYFNSQMKNDLKYVYLKVEDFNRYHSLSISLERDGCSFGPFRSRYILEDAIKYLKNLYPIRKEDNSYYFKYNLLPVVMDETAFLNNKTALQDIFSDVQAMNVFLGQLEKNMEEAAIQFKFERAGVYRDMISCLQYIKSGMDGYKSLITKNMVLKLPTVKGIKFFYIAQGIIVYKQTYASFNQNNLNRFIRKGETLLSQGNGNAYAYPPVFINRNEKINLDFRDILYSEISSMSEDMIYHLNE